MTIEVFWGSGSHYSWRVLLALEVKKIPWRSRLLQMSQREHKSPEYLALNPRGKVPAIRDGDFSLYESLAILAYVDRKWPDPPLFGRTPWEAGRVVRIASEIESYFEPPLLRLLEPLYFGGTSEKAEDIRAAAGDLHRELAGLDAALGTCTWLAGDAISAADCVLFPAVQTLLRAAGKDAAGPLDLGFLPLDERYPSLAAWTKRVEALPGYERTYPPHWK